MSEYLTLQEAADHIRLSPATLRRAYKRGEIGSKRGRLIFRKAELDRWYDEGRAKPSQSPDPMPSTRRSEAASLRELVRA